MNALDGLELNLKLLSGASPWKHTRNPIVHPEARTWRLSAEAKGFNRAARTLQQQQRKDRENATASAAESNNRRRRRRRKDEDEDEDDDDEISDVVQNRIITRILLYVGVPLATGIVLLKVLGAVKEQGLWDVPYWFPILTTFITFGASTLGVAYGALSTSWDENREGSFLGLEEAEKNWVQMWKEEEDD